MQKLLTALKHLDEITLMELLEITSEDLVDSFLDRIIDKEEWLYGKIQEVEDQD